MSCKPNRARIALGMGLGLAGCGLALGGFVLAGGSCAVADDGGFGPGAASAAATASSTAAATASVDDIAVPDADELFSNRDLAGTYDEDEAVTVELAGSSATVAAGAQDVEVDGSRVTITAAGTYVLTGTLDNGQVVVDAGADDKVQIVLADASVASDTAAALVVRQADKVFVTLAEGTQNSLVATGASYEMDKADKGDGDADEDSSKDGTTTVDGAVFSTADLTLNGSGSLAVGSAQGHGVVTKDDLVVAGGTYTVEAAGHALSGKDSIRVADGALQLTAGKNGLDSDHDDAEKGYMYLAGGSVTVTTGNDGVNATGGVYLMGGSLTVEAADDGVHSDAALVAGGATVDILQSEEGLEGNIVWIAAGQVSVVAADDGLNATAGSSGEAGEFGAGGRGGFGGGGFGGSDGSLISISGGTLVVDAQGDGIDSNGDLVVSGGTTYVSGPTNSGNGALDCSGTATVTGGVVVAVGAAGMAENFGSDSTQGSVLVNLSGASGTVRLLGADGNVLVEFEPTKSYSTVVVSCPELTVGETYTLQTGDQTVTVEMDALVTGSGSAGFGGFGGTGDQGAGRGGTGMTDKGAGKGGMGI